MIWSILLIIAVILVSFLVLVLLFILISPFFIGTEFFWSGFHGKGDVHFWWCNPVVFSCRYTISTGLLECKFFWWKLGKRKKEEPQSGKRAVEPDKIDLVEKHVLSEVEAKPYKQKPAQEKESLESQPETVSSEPLLREAPVSEVPAAKRSQKEQSESKSEGPAVEFETREKISKEKVSFFDTIRRNRVLFFIRCRGWRQKIIRWFFRLMRSVLQILVIKRFELAIKAGIEDPVLVGKAYGIFQAICYGAGLQGNRYKISFEPVFMSNYLEMRGKVGIKSSVGRLLMPAFVALFSFPYLSTLILWWRSRKLKRRPSKAEKLNRESYSHDGSIKIL